MAAQDDAWPEISGAVALRRYAPAVAAVLEDLVALEPQIGDAPLIPLVRRACAATLSLPPLPWSGPDDLDNGALSAETQVALGFAEQFSVDVSAITDSARAELVAALGGRTREFVIALYVADWAPRARRALDQLFPGPGTWPVPDRWNRTANAWPLVDTFLTRVAQLRELDPVTGELVRLRAARQHNCRLCRSLRNRSALAAGADESTFDALDDHALSNRFSDRHRAALALVDSLVWQPGFVDEEVVARVRRWFTPAEAVELVADMMRNASNKIAVSTASDGAHVSEGVEIYDVDADGGMRFGLEPPPGIEDPHRQLRSTP
ncbi:carboxymuconolactone decarboxylase family protein [Speluncibacter jeojiensis]|uniref:Carboxymuconolactone decarboxylase family protein n=1 Tax=Speluncibacter jeojiensis TaxID=2710754 RepID=A0A9X4LXS2_9ACTN|nr:carboxymuconolactone decarboxylase family protein [Corynebacteriales bacterium D3-21]